MFDLLSRLLPLIIGLIGFNGVFVNSCQPPPMGLYNAYNQYSNQQSQPQPYQPQQYQPQSQNYQPPFNPPSATGSFPPQQTFDQNQVLSAPIPPPTLVPSFLQDISPEDDSAAFESNSIIPISTSMPDTIFSPPPDPPANPFLGESKSKEGLFEENSSELLQEFSNRCSKNGVQNLRDLSDCIDGVQYSLTPMHAQFGSNKCDFEPEFICRFYSSPQEMIPFKSGQFRVDPKMNKLFEQTFSNLIKRPIGNFPEGSFVYLDIKDGRMHSSAATLKTDIFCQNGDGKLSFDYWTSDEKITLKVCTTDENERSCTQDIPYDREASRIEVDVIHPHSSKFSLEIVVSNFTKTSIFIIDNLDFVAKLCEDSAFIPEATTFAPPSLPSVRNQAFGSQIGQNFLPLSNQGFQPLNQASYHQNFAPATASVLQYGSYVTTPLTPANSFKPLPKLLPSPVFNSLRIKPSTVINEQSSSLQYSHQGFPVGGNNNNTSEISPGVAFVQNKYSLSPKRNLSPPKPMKLVPKLPIRPLTAACELLFCKFDKSFCHWKVQEFHGRDVRYGKWEISQKQVGNIHTGIKPKDRGGFAFVGMDPTSAKQNNRTIYILESPEFTLSNNTLLSFDLYRRSSAIMLQICLDSLSNCPYESPKLDSKVFWKEGESILLPQKTKKVYFVATQWKRFKWLAIDNIVLNKGLGCKGREAASSSSSSDAGKFTKIEEIRKFFRKQRIENRRI